MRPARFLVSCSVTGIFLLAFIIVLSAPLSAAATANTPTPEQTPSDAVEPAPGQWTSEEISFKTDSEAALPDTEGSLKLDFAVAEDKTSIMGTATLTLGSAESTEQLAVGSAWTAIIANRTLTQSVQFPFANLFFVFSWTGEFVSATELTGTATLKLGPAMLIPSVEWTATHDTEETSETLMPGPTSGPITAGSWESGEISFEIEDGPFADSSGTFKLDFTVNETDENTLGSASLMIAIFGGAGSWHAQRTGGLLSSRFTSAGLDPSTATYASWAGMFTAPDKIEGVAVVGIAPLFFETVEWSAAPAQK